MPAPPAFPADDLDAFATDPSLAQWLRGAPFGLILAGEPPRIVWCDARALQRFGVSDAAQLARKLIDGDDPGARRLRALADAPPAGAAPRLERLRYLRGPQTGLLTLAVRRIEAGGRILLAVAGHGETARPPADVAASVAALTPAAKLSEPAPLLALFDAPHNPPAGDGEAKPGVTQAGSATSSNDSPTVIKPLSAGPTTRKAQDAPAPARRFVWETDAQDRFVSIGPELAEAVGPAGALMGRALSEILAEAGMEPDGALAQAFARRTTWSGVPTFWRRPDADVAVDFFGAPLFERGRKFRGYRGFGVIRAFTPAQPGPAAAPLPAEAQSLAPAPHEKNQYEKDQYEAPIESRETMPAVHALSERSENDEVVEASVTTPARRAAAPTQGLDPGDGARVAARHVGQEHEALLAKVAAALSALGVGAVAASTLSAQAPGDATTPDVSAASPAHDEDAREGDEPAERPRTQAKTSEEKASEATTPAASAAQGGAERADAPSPAAPDPIAFGRDLSTALGRAGEPASSKIVQLRPVTPLRPTPPATPAAATPSPDASSSVSLSDAEKSAFREIARSLGARPSEERRGETKSAPQARDVLHLTDDAASTHAPPPAAAQRPTHEADAREAAQRDLDAPSLAPAAGLPALAGSHALATSQSPARNTAAMLDALPVGLLAAREDALLYANRTLLDLLGFADLAALSAAGGVRHMFRGREPERLREGAEGGAIPIVAIDGQVLPIDLRVQTLDWDGAPATLYTIRRSLEGETGAKLKTMELELRARQAETRELTAILDTATDGVAVLDAEGRLLGLNRSAEALFGYDQNEVAGESFTMLFTPPSQRLAADYLDGLKSNGVASVLNDGREVIGRERQGGSLPLFMTIGRISASGPAKFCAVLRDMTHWKKAERQLEEAKRDAERASSLKSDFLAKISHEIRTPLNAILGFAEVIMEERFGPVGNERYKDYLKDIHASGSHVMSLVNDLLDLSKIEAGKLELSFAAVDVNKALNECVSQMQGQALAERVILRVSLAPRLPQVVADERSIRQIAFNLLSNAIKFNEPGGQVIVSTALTDAGHAVIRVRDTGLGMSEDEIAVAMEPFRQIANAKKRGGTGLGLPLTKALAEANRASFSIRSRKAEGTLVEVAFPPTRVLAE